MNFAKLTRHRVPADLAPDLADIADRALQRYVDVMEGRVESAMAGHVLKASEKIRDEFAGPVPRDLNLRVTSLEKLIAKAAEPEPEGDE